MSQLPRMVTFPGPDGLPRERVISPCKKLARAGDPCPVCAACQCTTRPGCFTNSPAICGHWRWNNGVLTTIASGLCGGNGDCCCVPGNQQWSYYYRQRVYEVGANFPLAQDMTETASGTGQFLTMTVRNKTYDTTTGVLLGDETFQVPVIGTCDSKLEFSSVPSLSEWFNPLTRDGWVYASCDGYYGKIRRVYAQGYIDEEFRSVRIDDGFCRAAGAGCLTGACCTPDGNCLPATPAECQALLGIFLGAGVACSAASCEEPTLPPTTPRGGCCLPSGACIVTTQEKCLSLSGTYRGDGGRCDPPCPQPIGACCLLGGGCAQLTQSQCLAIFGTWFATLSCSEVTCTIPETGACCLPGGGCSQIGSTQCTALGGIWQGSGSDCGGAGGAACLTGACCTPSSHGLQCTQQSAASCTAGGGTPLGNGTTCTPGICTRSAGGAGGVIVVGGGSVIQAGGCGAPCGEGVGF